MENGGEGSVVVGAEEARRAAVLCPLVQANLNGTGSLESGINDAVCELGVSRATVWRWIKQLTEEGGRISAGALRKRGRPVGTTSISGKVEAVIEEHLRCHFLSRERSSLSRIVTEIRSTCGRRLSRLCRTIRCQVGCLGGLRPTTVMTRNCRLTSKSISRMAPPWTSTRPRPRRRRLPTPHESTQMSCGL